MAAGLRLRPGDAVEVAAGGVVDEHGNRNGAPSERVVVPPRERHGDGQSAGPSAGRGSGGSAMAAEPVSARSSAGLPLVVLAVLAGVLLAALHTHTRTRRSA